MEEGTLGASELENLTPSVTHLAAHVETGQ